MTVFNLLFRFVRALSYASVFVGSLLVFLPAQLLHWSGVDRPRIVGAPQATGAVLAFLGGSLALWCVLTFVFAGQGTPAPFDPPNQLVRSGPYRWLRNPMYMGAGLALGGAASFYQSLALLGYAGAFMLAAHLFVMFYEEPTLSRRFPAAYDEYRRRVARWWPSLSNRQP